MLELPALYCTVALVFLTVLTQLNWNTLILSRPSVLFRSELPLKLHEWHTIRVSRTARLAFLSVDSQETQSQLSAGAFDELTADQV